MGHLSLRELCEGNQEGGSFNGDPENMFQALEMDVCFHSGPAFREKWKDVFLKPLKKGILFLFRGIL
jgi:hypothetical protein